METARADQTENYFVPGKSFRTGIAEDHRHLDQAPRKCARLPGHPAAGHVSPGSATAQSQLETPCMGRCAEVTENVRRDENN